MPPITPEDWQRLEPLFDELLDLDEEARAAWWQQRARHLPPADRDHLRDLLGALDGTDNRLDGPLPAAAARIVSEQMADGLIGLDLGPYRVVREIDRGGMGVVYLGERTDGEFAQDVVIKVLRLGVDSEETRRRFRQERQILADLDHPAIVRLLDGGFLPDGRPYLVMHRIIGERIDTYCDRHRLDVKARVRLFLGVIEAVDHAHRHLVIHRDLKPGNVWVDEEGKVHLLDFGIAKIIHEDQRPEMTVTRERLLTPEYASPEQIRQETITTASDVYQLGLLLYHLLCGRPPYDLTDRSPHEIEQRICGTDPLPASRAVTAATGSASTGTVPAAADAVWVLRGTTAAQLRRALRGDLEVILQKALRKEPERRYQLARELRGDLIRWLSGDRIQARPDSLRYQIRRFVRRHPLGSALLAAIVIGGLAFTRFHVDRITAERDIARLEATRRREVSEFLVNLLQVPDPTAVDGREVTARELLAVSTDRIEQDLSDPETKIRLYEVVGEVSTNLGLFDQAGPALGMVVEHTIALHGEQSLSTAEARLALANLLRMAREYDDALAPATAALATRRALLPSGDPAIGQALKIVALIHRDLGEAELAAAELGEAADILSAALSPGDPQLTALQVDLAYVLRTIGRTEEAEELYRVTIPQLRSQAAEFQVVLPSALNNLGYLLRGKEEYAEAERCYREAIERNESHYGPSHPSTLTFRNNLAAVLHQQGKMEETDRELAAIAALQEHLNGPDHWRTGSAHRALGYFRLMTGDLPGAEASLRTAKAAMGADLGPDHLWTAGVDMQLAACLYLQGRHTEAQALRREYLPRLDTERGRAEDSVQLWLKGTLDALPDDPADPWRQSLARLLAGGNR